MSNVQAWKTWEGRTVDGKFPLRQWLGGSDHSAVFLSEKPGQPPQRAAIKLIPAFDAQRQLARWRTAAQLSHPNLVRIFEAGRCQIDGTELLYLVMEPAEEDLSQILPQRALTASEVSAMMPPLLNALSYLHGKGFVHSRIKPSNVQAAGDQLKLSADQIVLPGEEKSVVTRRDMFDAPETASGGLSPASDMWSLGALLVAVLTQKAPSAEHPRSDPTVPPEVPEPFRGIARDCLRVDPGQRRAAPDVLNRPQPESSRQSQPSAPSAAQATSASSSTRTPINRGAIAIAAFAVACIVVLLVFFSHGANKTAQSATLPQQSSSASTQAANEGTVPESVSPTTETPVPNAPARKTPVTPDAGAPGVAIRQVLPDVPQSARNTIHGKIKVAVRVDVNPAGKVTGEKLTTAGPSRYFANLALKASRDWEFTPPASNGQPIASAWLLTYRFGRARTEVVPQRLRR